MSVSNCVFVFLCLCVCVFVWNMCVCMCMCVCVCMCVYLYMSVHVCLNHDIQYMGKIWCGKKLTNLANRELFAKIFLTSINRYTEMYLAYALTVAYSPKFSSPIAFTCKVHQYFPCQIFSIYCNGCL